MQCTAGRKHINRGRGWLGSPTRMRLRPPLIPRIRHVPGSLLLFVYRHLLHSHTIFIKTISMRVFNYLASFTSLLTFSPPSFTPPTSPSSLTVTMSTSSVTIHASGSHTVRRTPELVDLLLRIHSEASEPSSALEVVRTASTEVAAHIRALASPKAEIPSVAIDSEELDVEDEKLDAAFPVTSWSLQQLRTWSVDPDDEGRPRPPRPQARMMMMAAAPVEEQEKPKKLYHAETYVRATFHDFAKLGQTIDRLTVSACHAYVLFLRLGVVKEREATMRGERR